ncbi:hypothetical protein DIS24_g551 [Lasiodiplodia hormozganensis]|uniref:Uncharacterized protein n=1 Tax=Lasiodiplodia hormozganensis TaxID=869390 RepID=A0AA39Z4Q4_9PEZI|nr:hypothetical protein DIS24_g551 [Lasiodiplodia hormozganensis]
MSVGPRPHATRSPSEVVSDTIADGNSDHRVTTTSVHQPSRSDPQFTARIIVGPPPWLQAAQNEKQAHEAWVQKERSEADETPQPPATSTRHDATNQNKTETALQSRSGAQLGPFASVPSVQPTTGYTEAGLTTPDPIAARGVGRTSPGIAAISVSPTAPSVQHSLSRGDILDAADEPFPDRYWDELPPGFSKAQAAFMWVKKSRPICPRCAMSHPPPHNHRVTQAQRSRTARRTYKAWVRQLIKRGARHEEGQQLQSQPQTPPLHPQSDP